MLGRAVSGVFTKVYIILLMNLWFWLYTAIGLVIAGVGPALRTISEMFAAHQWAFHEYHFKESWQLYRQYFVQANRDFWIFGVISAILGYNLFLSTQLTVGWMVFVQLALVLGLVVTITLWLFTLALQSHYEVSLKLAVKLAAAQFFQNFLQLLLFLFGVLALVLVSIKWSGALAFLSIGALVAWTQTRSALFFEVIDAQLAE